MDARPRFAYTPLPDKEGSIRVLQVLPDLTTDGLIQCRLSQSNYRQNDTYICLSYVWGSPLEVRDVVVIEDDQNESDYQSCGCGRQSIRTNLWNFLDVARTRFSSKRIWIDALCIDQGSIEERNSQVQIMGEIYYNRQLLIWLGIENDERIAQDLSIFKLLNEEWGQRELPQYLDKNAREGWADRSSWTDFVHHEYWSRAWITQELLNTGKKKILFGCTGEEYSLSEVIKASHFSTRRGRRFHSVWLDTCFQRHLLQLKPHLCDQPIAIGTGHSQTFLELLIQYSRQKCGVLADRIFSLRALCLPSEQEKIKVNYASTESELLVEMLQVGVLPLCFCSVRLLAAILSIELDSPEPCLLAHGLEFETERTQSLYLRPTFRCRTCLWRHSRGFPGEKGNVDVFCLEQVCKIEEVLVHVLKDTKSQSISIFVATWGADHTIHDAQAMLKEQQVDISIVPGTIPAKFRVRFSYAAILQLLGKWERLHRHCSAESRRRGEEILSVGRTY